MKGACPKCGASLKKGNIKVIRKPGKRPVRVCRRCQAGSEAVRPTVSEAIQPSQDKQGGPVMVTMVYKPPTTPNVRLFMTKVQQEKIERAARMGKPVTIELMTAAADTVEDNPEMFSELIELKSEWKAE
jgi:hypothetical protein